MIERVIQLFFFAGALFLAIPPIRSDIHAAHTVLPQMIWAGILFAAFLGIDIKFGRPFWQCIAIFDFRGIRIRPGPGTNDVLIASRKDSLLPFGPPLPDTYAC